MVRNEVWTERGRDRGTHVSDWSGLCTCPGANRCQVAKEEDSACWSGQEGVVEDVGGRGQVGPGKLGGSEVRAAGGFSRQERTSQCI